MFVRWIVNIGLFSILLGGCAPQEERFRFAQVSGSALTDQLLAEYSALLGKYVRAGGEQVDYTAWSNNDADVAKLKEVLLAIGGTDVADLEVDAAKAFYINAYNAMTLDLILSNLEDTKTGPVGFRSIRNIQNLNWDVWDDITWTVAGEAVSLNQVEKEILLKNFPKDARIHFAVNCASIGCPPLLNRAFQADTLDTDLTALAIAFVNTDSPSQTKFELDATPPKITTSKILEWYASDFETDARYGSVLNFFRSHVTVVDRDQLTDNIRIVTRSYDWGLNIAK